MVTKFGVWKKFFDNQYVQLLNTIVYVLQV
jgi:hypothetical protein